jgi:transposase
VRGEKVVDLWGGIRDARDGSPRERDTLVLVYSTSKGLAAMTLALAHSRGWVDYDERVTTYWPEFGQAGKRDVTVRQLLGHEAGVPVIDEPLDPRLLADFDALADVIARQRPLWRPGTRHGYHGVSFGSGSTCYRRLDEWQRAGVWERLHALLLAELRAAGEIEWSRAVADSSHVQATKGAPRRARARLIEPEPGRSTASW